MTADEVVNRLNELVEVSKDGQHGFETAARDVRNSELETMFNGFAKQRAAFALELQQEIERLGGNPADSGHLGGPLHRGWINLKAALSGGEAGPVIAACESGDDSAVASYSRVVDSDISGQTRVVVEKQYKQIQEALVRLRRLKAEIKDGTHFPKNE
jgi:uncharacterized protein (TIGR02284 family)